VVAKFLKGGNAGSARWVDKDGGAFSGAFQRLDFLDWAVVVQHPLLPLRALGWRFPVWAWIAWGVLAALIVAAVLLLQKTVRRMLVEMKELQDEAVHRADELKRMQASLLESRKMSAIGDLGAGVAHEFNNPLGGILGLTQLLLRRKKEGDADLQFLQRIEQEAKRCKEITDNLLRFSEQQSVEYREPLHLSRVLDMTVDLMTRKLESQRIEIEKKFAEGLPRVMGNEGQLRKAFLNRRRVGPGPDRRHRQGNRPGERRADLRALFHHKRPMEGGRIGSLGRLSNSEGSQRRGVGGEPRGPRNHGDIQVSARGERRVHQQETGSGPACLEDGVCNRIFS
jgi:hypothetical protein